MEEPESFIILLKLMNHRNKLASILHEGCKIVADREGANCYGTFYLDLFQIKLIYPNFSLVEAVIVVSIIIPTRIPGDWGWKTPKVF